MLAYIGRRVLLAIFTVWAISVLSFIIIQLPPGDYVTSYIAQMASSGSVVSEEEAQGLLADRAAGGGVQQPDHEGALLLEEEDVARLGVVDPGADHAQRLERAADRRGSSTLRSRSPSDRATSVAHPSWRTAAPFPCGDRHGGG